MDGPEEEMDIWSTNFMINNVLHLKSETSPISTAMTRIARCRINVLASWSDCLALSHAPAAAQTTQTAPQPNTVNLMMKSVTMRTKPGNSHVPNKDNYNECYNDCSRRTHHRYWCLFCPTEGDVLVKII